MFYNQVDFGHVHSIISMPRLLRKCCPTCRLRWTICNSCKHVVQHLFNSRSHLGTIVWSSKRGLGTWVKSPGYHIHPYPSELPPSVTYYQNRVRVDPQISINQLCFPMVCLFRTYFPILSTAPLAYSLCYSLVSDDREFPQRLGRTTSSNKKVREPPQTCPD